MLDVWYPCQNEASSASKRGIPSYHDIGKHWRGSVGDPAMTAVDRFIDSKACRKNGKLVSQHGKGGIVAYKSEGFEGLGMALNKRG